MVNAAILLFLLALVVTKVADVITTWRGLQVHGVAGEQNPLARWAMVRFGPAGGIVFVMLLWTLITVVCYVPAWFSSPWYQWATAIGGFLIVWAQWEVARFNATSQHSYFTRLVLRWYQRHRL
jgi:hypothetical protein